MLVCKMLYGRGVFFATHFPSLTITPVRQREGVCMSGRESVGASVAASTLV